MKRSLLLCLALALCLGTALAQERVVTGKVKSAEDGTTLPGVNVVLKGTTNGTVTDANGVYSLSVPSGGGILVFSFIGLQTQEVQIGERSVVDVGLSLDVQQLSEVVVTAAGIEREKKALGYSIANVSGTAMQQRSEPDPLRALQGKMPGVVINGTGGAPGQSTKINIRGFSTLTGNTQPLFVVDGIPFDNSVNESFGANRGTQFSNRAFDLDPNNIESITVLKGAAAAALYGSRATNGVVVVTTKAGKKNSKKGLEVAYNTSYNVEKISGIPDYQSVYMQGSSQNYNGGFIGNWGAPFPEYVDQLNNQYYGGKPRYSHTYTVGYPNDTFAHPLAQGSGNSLAPIPLADAALYPGVFEDSNGDGIPDRPATIPAKAYNNIQDFFQTGSVIENGINITNTGEKTGVTAGISRMTQEGIVPNQKASRTALNFGGTGHLDNGLFIQGAVNYVNTTQQTPQASPSIFSDYSGGSEGSVFDRLFYLPRNYNLMGYPFENPITKANIFYRPLDNPIWITKYNLYNSNVNRVYGNLTLKYDINDWLEVTLKGGINTYTDNRRSVVAKGSAYTPAGQIWIDNLTNTEQDYNLIFTVTKDLGPKLNFRGIVGMNANQREFWRNQALGTDFIVPGLFSIANTANQQIVPNTGSSRFGGDVYQIRRLIGVYTDLQFTYNKYLNVNFVARNDWASTLPSSNRSFFYPGVSASFLVNEATDALNNIFNNVKLRAAYTMVGREADPYLTSTYYNVNPAYTTLNGTFRAATLGNQLGNFNLKNELTKELEFGLELGHKSDRVRLDVTWFKRNSTNQIVPTRVSTSSGFSTAVVNAGEVQNQGWEVGLNITPVKLSNGFQWDIYAAYTRIRTLVVDVPGGELFVTGLGGGNSGILQNVQKKGFPYAQIYGTTNARDDKGNLLINESVGVPYVLPKGQVIGNPNPDFMLGLTNTFSWKGFTLTALLDWKQGGQIFSQTTASLQLRGMLASQLDREGVFIIPGVYGDPTQFTADGLHGIAKTDAGGNPIKNTTPITRFDYHFSGGFGAYGADNVNIYDATVVRLREVTLGYTIPKSVLSKTPFGSARISFSGRNLWWYTPNLPKDIHLDPEVAATVASSNTQGFETGATPTTKRYGVNLSLTF
ncbi:MAG: SusC/RagA family TonB-linked outer membrane protein [Bacteroidetes bacterium]|nr:SusC/RagA family TonB-linked outer membrane protein [Bacteroidota bacterium]